MGRQLALASQALGRSPYDDVVCGDGEGDDRAPLQMYDERGRPVNPETKRINKDVIRSHNEVMLVIGVAETDNGGISDSQVETGLKHIRYEERIGSTLLSVGRMLEQGNVWGVIGLRQRVLIYKEYSQIPFYRLYQYEKMHRAPINYLSAGLPSFATSCALQQLPSYWPFLRNYSLTRGVLTYLHLHLQMFAFLQRTELVSPSTWLPGLKFFIPFSASSPIPPPPPLTDFSVGSLLEWAGAAAINATPFVTLWLFGRVVNRVTLSLRSRIEGWVPTPTNGDRWMQRKPQDASPPELSVPAAVPNSGSEEQQPRNGYDIARDEATMQALEGHAQPEPVAPIGATVRRQSTFSTRGNDEYVSEDEETEVVSATLISFDVEAAESSDTPPGVWSAELRPNVVGDRGPARTEPVYRETALTQLPAIIATDILTNVAMLLVTAPLEATVLRSLARSFRLARGLPLGHIYTPSLLDNLSWTAVTNILGLEVIHLCMGGDLWAMMTMLAQHYRVPSEEWYNLGNSGAAAALL